MEHKIAILKGWVNYVKQTDIDEETLDKASNCVNAIDGKTIDTNLKDKYKCISGKVCSLCNCPLPTKLRQQIILCECVK